jgi:hypothetical protein
LILPLKSPTKLTHLPTLLKFVHRPPKPTYAQSTQENCFEETLTSFCNSYTIPHTKLRTNLKGFGFYIKKKKKKKKKIKERMNKKPPYPNLTSDLRPKQALEDKRFVGVFGEVK